MVVDHGVAQGGNVRIRRTGQVGRTRLTAAAATVVALALVLSGCTTGDDATPTSAPLTPGGSFVGRTEASSSAPATSGSTRGDSTGSSDPTASGPSTVSKTVTTAPTSRTSTGGGTATGVTTQPPTTSKATDSTDSPGNSASAPTKTGGVSAAEAADRKAVEAAWLKYWDVYAKLADVPKAQRAAKYATVAVDPELAMLIKIAANADKEGVNNSGPVVHRIAWPLPIDRADEAVITDCQDQSKFGLADSKTGQQLSVGSDRVKIQPTLRRTSIGVWKVAAVLVLENVKC